MMLWAYSQHGQVNPVDCHLLLLLISLIMLKQAEREHLVSQLVEASPVIELWSVWERAAVHLFFGDLSLMLESILEGRESDRLSF